MNDREDISFDKIGTGDLVRVSYHDGGANGQVRCLVGRASVKHRDATWLSESGDVLVRSNWTGRRIVRLEKASRRLPAMAGSLVAIGDQRLLRGTAEWVKMSTMETLSLDSAQRLANLQGWALLL